MLRTIGLKLVHIVPVLLLTSFATFMLIELVPGDAAATIAGETATDERIAEIREQLRLDDPLLTRYARWLGDTLTGNMGTSLVPPRQTVSELLRAVLPVTLEISLLSLAMALIIAVPASIISASRPGAFPDRALTTAAFASLSTPGFLVGLLLIFFLIFNRGAAAAIALVATAVAVGYSASRFWQRSKDYPVGRYRRRYVVRSGAVLLGASAVVVVIIAAMPGFPRQGFSRLTDDAGIRENLRTAFLPALTLASGPAAVWTRVLRSDLISTMNEDFILAARAKGMPRWRVILGDAVRPASFSLITLVGVSVGSTLGGTVIVERIFNLPGLGTMLVNSILAKDLPVVQGAVLFISVVFVVINAAIDIAYGFIDPRIRRGRL